MPPSGSRMSENFVATTNSSRRPAIASPTSSSLWPSPYTSAVSRKKTPRSSARWIFEIAPGNTIAFFEYAGQPLQAFAKPAGVPYEKAAQFDHLALHLPDEDALVRLRDRLKSHDCEVTDVVDHGTLRSIYFTDPSGI